MKLNVFERTQVLSILPNEGDFIFLKVLRDTQDKVGFTEKEIAEFNIKSVKVEKGIRNTWGPSEEKDKKGKRLFTDEQNEKFAKAVIEEREIEFGEKAFEIVKTALTELDKTKKLTPAQFTIYEKFVQDKEKKE
jgi:hypothetical protein